MVSVRVETGRKHGNKVLAIVLAVLAAAGLVTASMGRRWLTNHDGDEGIGLRAIEECDPDCRAIDNFEVVDEMDRRIERIREANTTLPEREQMHLPRPIWGGWPVTGLMTFIAMLLAAAGLVGGAIVAVAGKRPELPIMPTTVAVLGLLIGIIAGCVFIAVKPETSEPMAVGWSFMVFGAGAVLGLAAVFPLNRAIRPIDEDLGEASATMSWGTDLNDPH